MKDFLRDKKSTAIVLLTLLALIKSSQEGSGFALWMSGGVFTAGALDGLIRRIFFNVSEFPKSGVISGLIVAGILDTHQPWFVLFIFSGLAVVLKYLIRYQKRPLFNPANLSLFLASFFHIPLTWGLESNIPLIAAGGLYFAASLKKFPQVFGFLIFFCFLVGLSGQNPWLLLSWFFVSVMLLEPKTSGHGMAGGFVFGAVAGAASFLIWRFFPGRDFFTGSLVVANLCNPILEKIGGHKNKR